MGVASTEVPAKSLVPHRDGTSPSNCERKLQIPSTWEYCRPLTESPWSVLQPARPRRGSCGALARWEIRGRWNRHVVGRLGCSGRPLRPPPRPTALPVEHLVANFRFADPDEGETLC